MLDVPATTSSSPALNLAVSGLFGSGAAGPAIFPSFVDESIKLASGQIAPGPLVNRLARAAVLALSERHFDAQRRNARVEMAGAHGNRTHLPACDRYHGFEARGAHQVPFRSPDARAISRRENSRCRIFDASQRLVKQYHSFPEKLKCLMVDQVSDVIAAMRVVGVDTGGTFTDF